jgi:predicted transcriptional regulator of viral defense system
MHTYARVYMAKRSHFYVAEGNIKNYFLRDNGNKMFTVDALNRILQERRGLWNLPISMTVEKFVERLTKSGILIKEEILFEGYAGRKERYIVEGTTQFQVALGIRPRSFLSHYTAVYLNGLTSQIPKVIYVSAEQSSKEHKERDELQQTDIDDAFAGPQRKSGARAPYKDYTIVLLVPKDTGRIGVTTIDGLAVSGMERTLIDIAVRPAYAGGVQAVLDAYRKALPMISVNKLLATLETMDFVYPYHQAIGFYLDRAGFDGKKMAELRKLPRALDFYLTYEMKDPAYSPEWRLYYPQGM